MRILHTGDWHIGKTLARHCRLDETAAALDEVIGIAVTEDVDAVLVCGDVFEHQVPTAESEALAYRTLLRLHEANIPSVVIPGNHDHAERWGALKPLFDHCAVHVVPKPCRPDEGGIVPLDGRNGERLQVAALPWVAERRMTSASQLMGLEGDAMQGFAEAMQRLIAALCEPLDEKCCTVLAAHMLISGALVGGGERGLSLGQVYAVEPQSLPQVQYAALGHIHKPQQMQGTLRKAFYCGSLIQLDFGEMEQEKQVNIVDLRPGLPADVRAVPLTAGRRLRDVAGTLDELEAHREGVDHEWLRVILKCAQPSPGLAEQVREILPNALEVRLDYPRADGGSSLVLRGLTPRQQFEQYFQKRLGREADTETLDLFEKVLEEED